MAIFVKRHATGRVIQGARQNRVAADAGRNALHVAGDKRGAEIRGIEWVRRHERVGDLLEPVDV